MAVSFVTHLPPTLTPDPKRTVIRPFLPEDPAPFRVEGAPRGDRVVQKVLDIPDDAVDRILDMVVEALSRRHRDIPEFLARRFAEVREVLDIDPDISEPRQLLIGAYFSAEYSFEAAALFNPSIVPHPDQSDCCEGAIRFILSLRGIGEGHLSSVTFRSGTWGPGDDELELDPASSVAVSPVIEKPDGEIVRRIHSDALVQINCGAARDPSEVVLFPVFESQSRGVEDLRLVRLVGESHRQTYFGTYTAVGPETARQEILQTDDFRVFRMHPITGPVQDGKGMALFPRRIDGEFAALFRHDNENLWFDRSRDLTSWGGGTKILCPKFSWEIMQIGNCGSPIEIAEGWLVLTHGVGAVRSYSIGAALLDRDDPTKVLGRLPEPLIQPVEESWDGYVPNVVYSCGGLVRGRTLLLPYAVADDMTGFAIAPLDDLVAALR